MTRGQVGRFQLKCRPDGRESRGEYSAVARKTGGLRDRVLVVGGILVDEDIRHISSDGEGRREL